MSMSNFLQIRPIIIKDVIYSNINQPVTRVSLITELCERYSCAKMDDKMDDKLDFIFSFNQQ